MPIDWREPPRRRVGAIRAEEIHRGDYEFLHEDGTPWVAGDILPYRIIRKSDGKVMRPASWYPADLVNGDVLFVEEVGPWDN